MSIKLTHFVIITFRQIPTRSSCWF